MAKKKRKKRKVEDAEVPLSAMIDVTFLLLTYFIMTQTEVIEEAYISMNMVTPSKQPPPPVLPPTLDLHVVRDGADGQGPEVYWCLGRPYHTIPELEVIVLDYASNSPETIVNLKLGGWNTVEFFVQLLDLLAKAKLQEKLNVVYLKDSVYKP